MFGIGLPEMIVILAVALIVVGPDKLPELARSLAKGVMELKRTVNQVKAGLNEDGNILDDVHDDLKKTVGQVKDQFDKEGNLLSDVRDELHDTAGDLKDHLLDSESKTWQTAESKKDQPDEEVIDLQPLEERPWEKDRKQVPDNGSTDAATPAEPEADTNKDQSGNTPPASTA